MNTLGALRRALLKWVTIEHAILLTLALARGDELTLGHCERCDGLIVVNRLELAKTICPYCRRELQSDDA